MKTQSIALSLLLTGSVAFAAVQERVKKQSAADFPSIHAEVGRAWEAKKYGTCLERTRELLALISEKRTAAILAAFPPAPAGFEVVPQKKSAEAANPFAAAMAVSVGSVVEQGYKSSEGRGQVQMTVTADSPMVQMFSMWVTNPAMLGADAELIKYDQHNAVLKKEGSGWSLMILIDSSICELKTRSESDEFLLAMMPQAQVDRLAAALLN